MRKIIVLIFCLIYSHIHGQDPINIQFQFNKLEANPANGGYYGEGKVAICSIGKSAFNPIRGPFNLLNFNLDYLPCYTRGIKPSIGLLFSTENQGDGFLNITKISNNLGLTGQIFKNCNLSVGIKPGVIFQNIDWNELTFSDQLDPINGISKISYNQNAYIDNSQAFNLDLGFRLEFIRKNKRVLTLGASFNNVLNPRIGMLNTYTLPLRFTPQISYSRISNDYENFSYTFNLRGDFQNDFKCYSLNSEFNISRFTFGLGTKVPIQNKYGIKNNFFLSSLFAYQVDPVLQLFFSHEFNISGLGSGYSHGFEVGLILVSKKQICELSKLNQLFKYDPKDDVEPLNCPEYYFTDRKIRKF